MLHELTEDELAEAEAQTAYDAAMADDLDLGGDLDDLDLRETADDLDDQFHDDYADEREV